MHHDCTHQVGGQQDLSTVVEQILQGRDGSADARVIGDVALLVQGHVQICDGGWAKAHAESARLKRRACSAETNHGAATHSSLPRTANLLTSTHENPLALQISLLQVTD